MCIFLFFTTNISMQTFCMHIRKQMQRMNSLHNLMLFSVLCPCSLMKDYFFKPPINNFSHAFIDKSLESAYRTSYQDEASSFYSSVAFHLFSLCHDVYYCFFFYSVCLSFWLTAQNCKFCFAVCTALWWCVCWNACKDIMRHKDVILGSILRIKGLTWFDQSFCFFLSFCSLSG